MPRHAGASTAIIDRLIHSRAPSQLPVSRELGSPRGNVLLCHGLDQNDMVGVKPHHEGYDISSNIERQRLIHERRFRFVLNGHTHRSMLRSFGPLSIINAGTLLRDAERCFMLVDFERGELSRYCHTAGQLQCDVSKWTLDRPVSRGSLHPLNIAGGPAI